MKLSLEEKIGQMFMVGFSGKEPTPELEEFLERIKPGFIVLFRRNFSSPEQILALTEWLHSLGPLSPIIFTDQEGGLVCQLGEMASTYTSPMGLSATGEEALSKEAGQGIAEDLLILGFDGVLAPVLDVNWEARNPVIGARSFSDRAETVEKFAGELLKGVLEKGIVPVAKHFPGHGGTTSDSHLSLPVVEKEEGFLRKVDLRPFFSLAPVSPFLMTAHVLYPSLEPEYPATLSAKIIGKILRREVSYSGVVITDCLEMKAIRENFSPEEIIELGLSAGVDVFLSSHSPDYQMSLYEELLNAVKNGRVPEARIDLSLSRILKAKAKFSKKKRPPLSQLRAQRERELEICRRSIVLVRDRLGLLPLQGDELGIVEWEKLPSTFAIEDARREAYLEPVAKEYFPKAETLLLPLENPDFETIRKFALSHRNLLLAPYSRTPEAERLQGQVISEILKIREDAVVVPLANPYDLRWFPRASTYLLTFSFRECSLRALFEVLRGLVFPSGTLPVKIPLED